MLSRMVFKGLFGGGASVDTVLASNRVYPGGAVQGVVNVSGGTKDVAVNFVELSLTARVEVETEDSEYDSNVVFNKKRISGPFRLDSGARFQIPFVFEVPWEAPFNEVAGQSLHGVRIGVRTELDIARSMDKGDVDPIQILALPAQEQIVTAFAQIGFGLKGSDLERGRLAGSPLPFYQEVEFHPASRFRGQMNELEVKFVTRPGAMDVVLEIDRRSVFGGSSDKTNRFTVDFATAERQDWPAVLDDHLARIMGGGGFFGGGVDRHASPLLSTPPATAPQPSGYAAPAPGYPTPAPGYPAPAPGHPAPGYPAQQPGYPSSPGYPQQGHSAPPSYSPPPNPPAPSYSPPTTPPAPSYPPPTTPPATPGGGISLSKGGNVNLSREAQGLSAVTIGLGWDTHGAGSAIDVDASALVLGASGRTLSNEYFVFFNNLSSPDGAVRHGGDNATGAGHGDDEQIFVDLRHLNPEAERVVFAVSIHDGEVRRQNFGQVRNAYIRVADAAGGREIARYDLTQQAYSETAMIFGELYRYGADWKFRAVGQGFADGLAGITRSFGLTV